MQDIPRGLIEKTWLQYSGKNRKKWIFGWLRMKSN